MRHSGSPAITAGANVFAAKGAVNKAVIHRTRDFFEAPDSNLFRVGDFIGLGPEVARDGQLRGWGTQSRWDGW